MHNIIFISQPVLEPSFFSPHPPSGLGEPLQLLEISSNNLITYACLLCTLPPLPNLPDPPTPPSPPLPTGARRCQASPTGCGPFPPYQTGTPLRIRCHVLRRRPGSVQHCAPQCWGGDAHRREQRSGDGRRKRVRERGEFAFSRARSARWPGGRDGALLRGGWRGGRGRGGRGDWCNGGGSQRRRPIT